VANGVYYVGQLGPRPNDTSNQAPEHEKDRNRKRLDERRRVKLGKRGNGSSL